MFTAFVKGNVTFSNKSSQLRSIKLELLLFADTKIEKENSPTVKNNNFDG
jgi:microcompartment protein CcmK/EutM